MENTGAASGGPPAHDRDGHQQPEIDELRRQLRQAAFTADIGRALTRGDSLADLLQRCAMAIVAHLDAAFARVWTLRAGADVLVLQASAGLYTHLDGPHGRIPVGALKIGRIAATRQPHLTNDVLTDPYISDHAWAAREGMAAFAGYPLQVDDRLVGVMALFARHPLSPDTLATLSSVADMVAFGIDRARLDEAARRARDEAQATLVVGSVGTWRWDLEHNVAEVGDSYRRLLGLPDAGDQISAERFFKVLHPDDQPRLASYIERILVERRPVDIEYRIRYPGGKEDGDVRWLLSRGGPVVDVAGTVTDILGASVDITARKDAEATIQRQARLIDLSYEPIFVRGEDDGIVEWNRGAEQLYGYTRDDAIGKRSHDLLQTIHPMPIAAVLAALDRDGAWTGEPRHMAKDGRVVVVESRQQAIDIDGRRLILETNRDITERIRAEYERQTILDSLTHDLKNPLTAMLGQTQLLQRQITRQGLPDAASLTARLAEFEEQATWMNELIEELSDHARLTAGQPVELTIESTDLVALVRDVVAKFPATTGPHAIRFDPEDSAMVGDWDQRRLRRVVANLLGNALKYSPAGGEILVRLIRFKATAVLEVRDEGIGIPAADLPYVFDVRRRGGNVGTITGSGVGLAGAKQIVEQHRGTITAESQAGAGSTFTVTLPLSAQDAT